MAKKTTKKKATRNKSPKATKPTKKKAKKKPVAKGSDNQLVEQLVTIFEKSGSVKKCLAFLEPLTEPQRRKLAATSVAWLKKLQNDRWLDLNTKSCRFKPAYETAGIAVLATASFTEIRKFNREHLPDDDICIRILSLRKPDLADKFVEHILRSDNYWAEWELVRTLVRNKICSKPDNERYYTGMISGLRTRWDKGTTLSKLKKDPDLLKDEIWRLFEFEGHGENTLANADRFEQTAWDKTLISLSKSGKLPRKRLLDSALSALELGFNHYRSRWFFDFFDAMKPTEKELQSRANTFINLVNSPIPNIAKWAFAKVEKLVDANAIKDVEQLATAISPMLMARGKAPAVKALKFLEKLATENPRCSDAVAMVTTEALGHEKVDVQKAAFKLISKYGHANDPNLVNAVSKYQPVVAASFKKTLAKWLDSANQPLKGEAPTKAKSTKAKPKNAPSAFDTKRLKGFDKTHIRVSGIEDLIGFIGTDTFPIPAATFDGSEIPRLDPDRKIEPINDLEELIDTLARMIEAPQIDDVERALDGMSRLCDQRPENFDTLTGPLLKRSTKLLIKKIAIPFNGFSVDSDIKAMIYCWITQSTLQRKKTVGKRWGEDVDKHWLKINDQWVITRHSSSTTATRFLSRRTLEITERAIEGQNCILLSAPTHEGGLIDPVTFVERINNLKVEPTEIDLVASMLRLAPDCRSKALKKLKPKLKPAQTTKWLPAVKHALGAKPTRVGKNPALWVAAARSRSPWEDDPKVAKAFPKLGPDCGNAAKYKISFPKIERGKKPDRWVQHACRIRSEKKPSAKRLANIPTQLLQMAHGKATHEEQFGSDSMTVKWRASIWPIARESLFAIGVEELANFIDSSADAVELEFLLDADTPLRDAGLLLLITGLALKNPGQHGMAVDAAILAITDGRLGTDNLGQALASYLPTEHFSLSRWAQRFAEIAAASDLHAYVVLRSFETALRGDPNGQPRRLSDIIGLMSELSSQLELAVQDPECRSFLEQLKGASKLAKNAKTLLAIESTSDSQQILDQSIENRMQRLAVWQARG